MLSYLSNSPMKNMPKSVSIKVYSFAPSPKDPNNKSLYLYKEKILQFDVILLSKIKVESSFRRGLTLNSNHREETFKVYSNVPFTSSVENQA